jgi:hypothetical protein
LKQCNIVVKAREGSERHEFFKQWSIARKTASNGILEWKIQRETDGFPLNKEYHIP